MCIRFRCGKCGGKLKASEENSGKPIRCPKCNNRMLIPEESEDDSSSQESEEG